MSLAEKKQLLLTIVENADEETTAKLIEFFDQLEKANKPETFSKAELERFHDSRQAYLQKTNNSFSLEDAHAYIRSLKK